MTELTKKFNFEIVDDEVILYKKDDLDYNPIILTEYYTIIDIDFLINGNYKATNIEKAKEILPYLTKTEAISKEFKDDIIIGKYKNEYYLLEYIE